MLKSLKKSKTTQDEIPTAPSSKGLTIKLKQPEKVNLKNFMDRQSTHYYLYRKNQNQRYSWLKRLLCLEKAVTVMKLKRCLLKLEWGWKILEGSCSKNIIILWVYILKFLFRDTQTSAGPNSFGKTRQGFCDAKKVFERQLKKAIEESDD